MADQKLSELTALAVEPADSDEFYINDGGTSKRITYGTIKAAFILDADVDSDIKTLDLPPNTTISAFGATLVDDADAATARATLGVDAAGTDNSTDVTIADGLDYVTLTGQELTLNAVDLATDVTGALPASNIDASIITGQAADSPAAAATGDLLLIADVSASPVSLKHVTAQSIADLASVSSIEGTNVLSTGEAGGTKFLREDGDGTSSWQAIPAPEGTSVLSTGPVTDGYVLTADGAGGAAWEAAAGGVDWSTTQTTTGDFTFKLPDAAGASKLSLTDSADAEVFSVDSDGVVNLNGGKIGFGNTVELVPYGASGISVSDSGYNVATLGINGGIQVRSTGVFGWTSGASSQTPDLLLYRDAANTLALRNSTNAQTLNVYGTYTDSSNYERLAITGSAITVQTAGTGTDDIDLTLTPAGAGNVKFGTHSAISAETVTGYITIKDSSGTTRKLAVVS